MKPRTIVFTLLTLAGMLGLPAFASASSGCNPNGHQFDLEGLVDAPLFGQADESVALLLGRGRDGADLVVGAGLDGRPLDFVGYPNPVYYAERDNANCVADFEGGVPGITDGILGTFVPLQGYPQVVADPVHDAFFLAAVFASDTNLAVGIIRSTAANLLNTTNCPNGTQRSPAFCWTVGSVTNIVPENTFVSNPTIGVDQRKKGTGAGDVYNTTSWSYENNQGQQAQIILAACTNAELNSTLATGIRSRIVNNVNVLAIHMLEAGFETKQRPCIPLHGFRTRIQLARSHASPCGSGISCGRPRSTRLWTHYRVG